MIPFEFLSFTGKRFHFFQKNEKENIEKSGETKVKTRMKTFSKYPLLLSKKSYMISMNKNETTKNRGGWMVMSIKKIAKEAGVSVSTVSRVLNDPGYRCSIPGARDKIWKLAMLMNYVPNEAAKNLKTGKKDTDKKTFYINVLMTRTDSAHTDPFYSELLRVIESEIHKHFCILSKIWYEPELSDDKKCKKINLHSKIQELYAQTEGKNDGLIIIGKCNKEALRLLKQTYKSVVAVNRNSTNYEVDEVTCDGEKISGMAVEHLIELGHTDIAYVGACHNEARYRGFLNTLKKHEIEVEPSWILETRQTEADGYETMKKILAMEEMPTGIYCANDITAIGMLKCLNRFRNKLYVPSIIASDDIEEAQNTKPMLTTVRLPKEDMGKFAMYLLVDRMKDGHQSVTKMELEGRLMIRNSCAAPSDHIWSDYCI